MKKTYYAILITLIFLGFFMIVLSSTLAPAPPAPNAVVSPPKWWDSWPKWLETLGTTLLIVGSLGVIEKAVLSTEAKRELQKLFRLHESTDTLGLESLSTNAGNYDYKDLVETSPDLRIVMNDARTWVSSRIDQFQVRFANKHFVTEVYVVDPNGSFAPILAAKTGYDIGAQQNKIQEAVKRFIGEWESQGKNGVLKIYFLRYYPTHSIVIGAKKAVFTLYGISTGRRAVPTFEVHKTEYEHDLFTDMLADVEKLKSEATLHFDSAAQQQPNAPPAVIPQGAPAPAILPISGAAANP
jgi:hypothetical protein